MLKAQHPEYEFFTAGTTHYKAGVSCADCHMPYVRDGAAKYSSHDVHSPLLNPEQACGQCHTDSEYVVGRVNEIQEQVATTKADHRRCDHRRDQRHQGSRRQSASGCSAARPGAQPAPQSTVHVGLRLC